MRKLAVLLLVAVPVFAESRRFTVRVTPEMLLHSRIRDVLYFAGFAYTAAVLVLLLRSGASARLRDMARRRTFLYAAMLIVAIAVLEFPLSLYSGFLLPHRFRLTQQTFAAWLADFGKGLAVEVVVGAIVATLAIAGIRRFRRWWIALWIGSIPLIVFTVLVAPLVIDPLFNEFVPLRDPVLREALLDQAARAGIEGGRVYEVDKSKQTTTMNAYVAGIGPTKRIVMWDTLLAKLDREEVLAVMGHEMGHYVLHHIWLGLAFALALSLVAAYFAQKMYERSLAKWGGRWRVEGPADPAALPAMLLLMTLMAFVASPLVAGFSRHIEREADRFAIELTGLNEALASTFVKFAEDSKVDPDPPRFIEWWRYSHPAPQRRIDAALRGTS